MKRIKPWEALPYHWWFFGILENGDGTEYYIASLRLPSYKWDRDFYQDYYCWLQLTIVWHGRDGFRVCWLPCARRL